VQFIQQHEPPGLPRVRATLASKEA
jgi:hypothetical protein